MGGSVSGRRCADHSRFQRVIWGDSGRRMLSQVTRMSTKGNGALMNMATHRIIREKSGEEF